MKKITVFFFSLCFTLAQAQWNKRLFSKDPIINLENFQKQKVHFGFYMGFNGYDFKVDYKNNLPDIIVKRSTGFNVGLVSDLRLHEYIDLRFEPGLYYTKRDLYYPSAYFPFTPTLNERLREVNSTYIHFPLLVKFSSLRTGNVRPYLVGGGSLTLNLSSNAKSLDDNAEGKFRMKAWTPNYELGFGIDIFSEYFIFSPSIRGVFGINDELIRDKDPNSSWTSNIESMKSRAIFVNFTFH
ncbi:MAG: porin family protein [Flavobacterium sp.]